MTRPAESAACRLTSKNATVLQDNQSCLRWNEGLAFADGQNAAAQPASSFGSKS